MTVPPALAPVPVRIRAADGSFTDDGLVHLAHRPVSSRLREAAMIAGGGTVIGVLLLPVPLVHIFGLVFMFATWGFAFHRARTTVAVVDAGGTCPRCHKEVRFFVGFGRKRYRLPLSTSCPACSHALTLEARP